MDNRINSSRNGACSNYNWDGSSAVKKLTSGLSVRVNIPNTIFSISKEITPSNDPNVNAYRNCSNCKKHFNYHGKNDNGYKNSQINPFPKNK